MKHETIDVPLSERKIDAAMIDRARAGYASGYGVEHTVVSAWLRTWGKRDEKSFEDWLNAWNG